MTVTEFGVLRKDEMDLLVFEQSLSVPILCCWEDKDVYYGNLSHMGNHVDILDKFPNLLGSKVAYATEVRKRGEGVMIVAGQGGSIDEYVASYRGQNYMKELLSELLSLLGRSGVEVR